MFDIYKELDIMFKNDNNELELTKFGSLLLAFTAISLALNIIKLLKKGDQNEINIQNNA